MIKEPTIGVRLGTMEVKDGGGLLHVSLVPPAEGPRKPCTFICMIDTSFSMRNPCTEVKAGEHNAFSILDLVKHSLKTLVHMLTPDDYVAFITFSDTAKLVMELTQINEEGKKSAQVCIDVIEADGGTNIWDALRLAIDLVVANPICKTSNTNLWLFTDGEPNTNPPAGIIPTFLQYYEKKKPKCTICTFGFGYKLDSQLLFDIASIGNGVMCYLPDVNLVGTTFVNCLCNALATAAYKINFLISGEELPNWKCIGYEAKGNFVKVGGIQYGQTRDFIFQFDAPKKKDFSASIQLRVGENIIEKKITGFTTTDPVALYRAFFRSKFNELALINLSARLKGKEDSGFLEKLSEMVLKLPCKDDPYTQALMRDLVSANELEGRVGKAFSSEERIKRWGSHYVRSIVRAHQMQQCHNFKDPGVQVYGGKMFRELQQKADVLFCSLPPPVGTRKKTAKLPKMPAPITTKKDPKSSLRPPTPPLPPSPDPEMAVYLFSGGGCFDGLGEVRLANGQQKKVKELTKGDTIVNSSGQTSTVLCLVAIKVQQIIDLVPLNGVKVTPKHPVRHCGVWKFPKDIEAVERQFCSKLYNLILDNHHVVTINGFDFVTLGHGISDNETVAHYYYGAKRCVEDLASQPGWNEGKVVIQKLHKVRDPFTRQLLRIEYHV